MAIDGTGDGSHQRLAVLRALGLGDLLTAVPALRALRAAFPEHRLLLAAPAPLAPLVRAARLADAVVPTDLRAGAGPAPEERLNPRLDRAAVAVNLHGAGPQSHRMLLATAPERLLAFASPHAGVLEVDGHPPWIEEEHEVRRWCRLLEASGIPADPGHLGISVPSQAPAELAGATVLHAGAASPARRWPVERWAAVARAESASGRRVVLTGGEDEATLAWKLAAAAGLDDDAILAGRTDVLTLAAIVGAAARVVCGDTGVAHLATALGTPSVVLFGPVPPSRWGPPPDRPQHRALWSGRVGNPHAGVVDPGLASIGVTAVLDALASLPDRRPVAPVPT